MGKTISLSLFPSGFFGSQSSNTGEIRRKNARRTPKRSVCLEKSVSLSGSTKSASRFRISSFIDSLRTGNWRRYFSVSSATQGSGRVIRVSVKSQGSLFSNLSAEEARTGNYSETTIDNAKVDDDGKKVQKNSAPKPQAERGNFVEKEGAATPKLKAIVPAVSPRGLIAVDAEAAKVEQPATVKNPAEEKARLEKEREERLNEILELGEKKAMEKILALEPEERAKGLAALGAKDTENRFKEFMEKVKSEEEAATVDFNYYHVIEEFHDIISEYEFQEKRKKAEAERIKKLEQTEFGQKILLFERGGVGTDQAQKTERTRQEVSAAISKRSAGKALSDRMAVFQPKEQQKLAVN